MAPLPHNNTPIYFLDYGTVQHVHTLEVRATAAVSPATFGSIMDAFLTQLSPVLNLLEVTGARFQAAGSNFANPVTVTIAGQTYGDGVGADGDEAKALNFVGRSSGGRRVRLMLFGYKANTSDFRVTAAENTAVAAAIGTLNNTANAFLAIDGVDPVWYPYANVIYNAYWQRKARS